MTMQLDPVLLDPGPVERTSRWRRHRGVNGINWWLTALLAVGALTIIVPFYFTIAMSLKSDAQAVTGSGLGLPTSLHFSNFSTAWHETDFPYAFMISGIITVIAVFGELVVSSLAAWAIVRNWHKRVFKYSFWYLSVALFLPFPVVAIEQVKLTALLHLDNPFGVAILHIMFALSFNVLLYSSFLRSLPEEIEESARMDGCSTWQTFRTIVFPLLGPMNATVGIFAFLGSWNDYMMPFIITANPHLQTIPVVQELFQTTLVTHTNVASASYLMAMIPAIIGYMICQKWVVSGVMRGAIK
jgi:raffinose/stachyose/melibiose transport system permease protein